MWLGYVVTTSQANLVLATFFDRSTEKQRNIAKKYILPGTGAMMYSHSS